MKICFFALILGWSCNFTQTNKDNSEIKNFKYLSNSITLIFNKHKQPDKNIMIRANVSFQSENQLIRIWDDFHSKYITPNGEIIDTIVYTPTSESILLQHVVNYFDEVNIILNRGDTIEVDYNLYKPIFTIKNRKLPNFELCIDSVINSSLKKINSYNSFTLYKYPIFSASGNSAISSSIFDSKPEYGKQAISDFNYSRKILDSLYAINEISKELYHVMNDKFSYLEMVLKVDLDLLSNSEALSIFDSMHSDLKLPYSFALNFSEEYVNKFIHPKYKKIKRQSSMDLDYVSIYEDLELSTYLPPRIKELLLYKYLVLIGKNLPITTFRSFSKRFQESTSDSILVNNINTAFFLDFDRLRLVSDSVFLIDSYKNVTTLKSILEKNKDRVIYIDFWASWCLPCLKLLPASKKLSETYKNDSVSVIYLSIDRNYDDWRKSASKNDLLFHDNSFLIVNPATASYLNKLKLNEIPRYLLFDKKGNLIYEKAPHPDDEELKTVIKGLL